MMHFWFKPESIDCILTLIDRNFKAEGYHIFQQKCCISIYSADAASFCKQQYQKTCGLITVQQVVPKKFQCQLFMSLKYSIQKIHCSFQLKYTLVGVKHQPPFIPFLTNHDYIIRFVSACFLAQYVMTLLFSDVVNLSGSSLASLHYYCTWDMTHLGPVEHKSW